MAPPLTPEMLAGQACTDMHARFAGSDWTRELPAHIRVMLGNNEFGVPLWKRRAMPPTGQIFELNRFEDYLMKPFREGLGFTSWWTIHAVLETQGANGLQAIALIRKKVRDYDGKVQADRRRTLNDREAARPEAGGRPRKGEEYSPLGKGGSADRLIARLKRDAPQIAERLAAGEFRSARAAAIEAGIIAETPPLTILRRAWKRASPQERAIFMEDVKSEPQR